MRNPIFLYSMFRHFTVHIVLVTFIATLTGPLLANAQEFKLPAVGVMVHLSPEFNPPILKGIKLHSDNPLRFDFILDKGDGSLGQDQLKEETNKLIKYFLASLTIPDEDIWVNLSPYEKNRIIPDSFGLTEMGRDLLAEDYILKQITASLIYPEDELGKKFWKKVYEEAAKKYKTTSIPVNTFNKVWIVPQKAIVYENAKTASAYVVESKLKVMLEQDYVSLQKHEGQTNAPLVQSNQTSQLGSQIIREIVLPELEREVNQGKNFIKLRQVYQSLILATWYKKKIKDGILNKVYKDKAKVDGINIDDPNEKNKIYQQYVQAFKKGVYNYIKEEIDPLTKETIPRKYFSGGVDLMMGKEQRTKLELPPEAVEFSSDETMISNLSFRTDNAMEVTADIGLVRSNDAIKASRSLKKELLQRIQTAYPEALSMLIPTAADWYISAHPEKYHGQEHSIETGFTEGLFAFARANKGSLDLADVLFLWQVGILHDFEPGRANTMAHVPATLQRLEDDWNRISALNGRAGFSVLREEFGWSETQYWTARAIIQRSEYPFGTSHGNPFYKTNSTSPLQEYEKILRKLNQLDASGKSVAYAMRESYLFSEIIDKANGYMRKEFDGPQGAKQMVLDLHTEMVFEGVEISQIQLLKRSFGFLSSIGDANSSKLDSDLLSKLRAEGINIDKVDFLSRDQSFEFVPSDYVKRFNENLVKFKEIKEGLEDAGVKAREQLKKRYPNLTNRQIENLIQIGSLPNYVYRGQPDQKFYPIKPKKGSWSGFLMNTPDDNFLPPADAEGNRMLMYVGNLNAGSAYASVMGNSFYVDGEKLVSADSLTTEEIHRRSESTETLEEFAKNGTNNRLYRIKTEDIIKRMGPDAVIVRDSAQPGKSWAIVGRLTEAVPGVHIMQRRVNNEEFDYVDTSSGRVVKELADVVNLEPVLDKEMATDIKLGDRLMNTDQPQRGAIDLTFDKNIKWSDSVRVSRLRDKKGKYYFLKTFDDESEIQREYFAYKIARLFGVNVPNFELVSSAQLQNLSYQFQKGLITTDVNSMNLEDLNQKEGSGLEEAVIFVHFMRHIDFLTKENKYLIEIAGLPRHVLIDLLTDLRPESWSNATPDTIDNLSGLVYVWSQYLLDIDPSKLEQLILKVESLSLNDFAPLLKDVDQDQVGAKFLIDRTKALRSNIVNGLRAFRAQKSDEPQVQEKIDSILKVIDHSMTVIQNKRGGIDLTADKINLQTKNDGGEIKLNIDSALLVQLQNAAGFKPQIIGIKPLESVPAFLGISSALTATADVS